MSPLFDELSLHPLVFDGIAALRFREMTPVQARAIPIVLEGCDLIAAAQTGTGKTAAFLIPLIEKLVALDPGATRALVLVPTRELALQINEQLTGLGYYAEITSECIVGGLSFGQQEEAIRGKADVLIVTPGRMIDHMRYDHVDFRHVDFVVLDEADRMLDMGFLPDVRRILAEVPQDRQTLLFSATISPEVKKCAAEFLREPKIIQVARQVPVSSVAQRFFSASPRNRESLLLNLLRREATDSVLVFAKTKKGVQLLARKLHRGGISCDALHGDLSQEDRIDVLEGFRRGDTHVLVATDIASRGLDINNVSHVINFDMPMDPDDYIHRVGRTARAEMEGDAITFVTPRDVPMLRKIEKAIGQKVRFERLERSQRPRSDRKRPRQKRRRS